MSEIHTVNGFKYKSKRLASYAFSAELAASYIRSSEQSPFDVPLFLQDPRQRNASAVPHCGGEHGAADLAPRVGPSVEMGGL